MAAAARRCPVSRSGWWTERSWSRVPASCTATSVLHRFGTLARRVLHRLVEFTEGLAGGRQARFSIQFFLQHLFEIPAGRLEAGEAPLTCAHRELLEETGCTATSMDPLTTFWTTPGFTDERIHIYLASGITRGATAHEADEFIEVVTVPLSEALRRIEMGEITDAKTMIGILFAAGFRAGR